jgi:hypothetical protein
LLLVLCGAMMAAYADGTATLYVARRGWHVDIGLSAAELAAPLDAVAADLPGMSYVFFGFADKHYLLAKHRNAPVLLGALWPGDGIMLVTGLASSPDEAFGAQEVIALSLNAEQLHALQSFIWKSLRTPNESLSVYQTGPYEGSLYFLAAPKYSASHTCNTWGAEALRAAGFQVHTAGVVFAAQLWSQARRIKQTQDRKIESFPALRLLRLNLGAGGTGPVLAHHSCGRIGRYHDRSLGRGRGAAAADAAGKHRRRHQQTRKHFHGDLLLFARPVCSLAPPRGQEPPAHGRMGR